MLEIPDVKLQKTDSNQDRYWIVMGNIAIMGSLEELNALGFQIETLARREIEQIEKGDESHGKSDIRRGL